MMHHASPFSAPRAVLPRAVLLVMLLTLGAWGVTLSPAPTPAMLQSSADQVMGSINVAADAPIVSSTPTTWHGLDSIASIGGSEGRWLLKLPLRQSAGGSLPAGDVTVSEAMLELQCTQPSGSGDVLIQPAMLQSVFNPSTATWNQRGGATAWGTSGADGAADRGDWEPGTWVTTDGAVSVDLTALAQQALIASDDTLQVVLAGVGGDAYECDTARATITANRPVFNLTWTTSAAPAMPTLTSIGPENGTAATDGALAFSGDTTPALTWSSSDGDGIEVQLSRNADFRDASDGHWHWTSWDDAGRFSGTASGTFTTPGGAGLAAGDILHQRMRPVQSAERGDWTTSWFVIPMTAAIDNGDGTASLDIRAGSTTDEATDAFDAWLREGSPTTADGGLETLKVGHAGSNNRMTAALHFELGWSGVPLNATVVNATLELKRQSSSGTPIIVAHPLSDDTWETDATWDGRGDGSEWYRPGAWDAPEAGEPLDMIDASSGSTLSLDVTSLAQAVLFGQQNGGDRSVDLVLVGGNSGNNSVVLNSSEAATAADRPTLSVTFKWNAGSQPAAVDDITPGDGQGVWNVSDDNLSANMTPVLTWNTTGGHEIILELADQADLQGSVYHRWDSRVDSEVDEANGFAVADEVNLTAGDTWWWRITYVDSDQRGIDGGWRTFVIPAGTSSYIAANDTRYIHLREGNATGSGGPVSVPDCQDTHIFGGSGTQSTNYDDERLWIGHSLLGGNEVGLWRCDVRAMQPPSGYAIAEAWVRFRVNSIAGSPVLGLYANNNHDWREGEATWLTSDGATPWDDAGAAGSERGAVAASVAIAGTGWYQINVTAAAQLAVRNQVPLDFILDMTLSSSGNIIYVELFDASQASTTNRPELALRYVSGSATPPNAPAAHAPAGDAWSVQAGLRPVADDTPQLSWTYDNATLANGFEIQLDQSSGFDSANLVEARSWDSGGFNLTTHRFDMQSALDSGYRWYWRVRAVSATGQVGEWSAPETFLLPDVTTSAPDADTAVIELRVGTAMSSLGLPAFEDTYIDAAGAGLTSNRAAANTLEIGHTSGSGVRSGLLRMPLDQVPLGTGGRLVDATLNLRVTQVTNGGARIAAHGALRAWTEAGATGTTADGSQPWQIAGALDSSDRGETVDMADVSTQNWWSLNVTELAQAALSDGSNELSLVLSGDSGSPTGYLSVESTESFTESLRPWLKLTFVNGTETQPTGQPTLVAPSDGGLTWNTSSVAPIADDRPVLNWSHTDIGDMTGWRVFIHNDANDERAGWVIHDSRENATAFDIANGTWQPPGNFSEGSALAWHAQGIVNGLLTPRSSMWEVNIPNSIGEVINSTTARVFLQQGLAVQSTDAPAAWDDSYIRKDISRTNYGSSTALSVGSRSTTTRATVLEIDVSKARLPEPWRTLDAHLELYRYAGTSGSRIVSVMPLLVDPVESVVTWTKIDNSTNWAVRGGLGGPEVGPVEDQTTVTTNGWYRWNVTHLVQQAHVRGDQMVRILLVAGDSGTARHDFRSSEYLTNRALRPILNVTYRIDEPEWIPAVIDGATPIDDSTLWNLSAPRPRPTDEVVLAWNHSAPGNLTAWHVQLGSDDMLLQDHVLLDSDADTSASGAFDEGARTFTFLGSTSWPDSWTHWRVRSVLDERLGNWSDTQRFRVPPDLGWDDGDGNQSVNVSEGGAFDAAGPIPSTPDTFVDGGRSGTNFGSNVTLALGSGSGSGEAWSLFAFDLAEVPLPANVTITQAELRLHQDHALTTTSDTTIGAHDCPSFNETNVTWSSRPTCNATAMSTTTLLAAGGEVWYGWDVTDAVTDAGTDGGVRLALRPAATPNGRHVFDSAESADAGERPILIIHYVLGPLNTPRPATPMLISPANGDVLYDMAGDMVGPDDRPTLSWTSVPDSTGYILTVTDGQGGESLRLSWRDPGFSGTNFTFQSDLTANDIFGWRVRAINGSMPGPQSDMWFFGLPAADASALGDLTWQVDYRESHDITTWRWPAVHDTHISSGSTSTNFGSSALQSGTGCDRVITQGDECLALIEVDLSQIPLPNGHRSHGLFLELYVEAVDLDNANLVELAVHPLLGATTFDEASATWDQSSRGTGWPQAGMLAGVTHAIVPISTRIVDSGDIGSFISFDISALLPTNGNTNNTVRFVINGTPDNGHGFVELASGEDVTVTQRPSVGLRHTPVHTVAVAPGPRTVNADNTLQLSHTLADAGGSALSASVEWNASNGSIGASGLFTPWRTGAITVTARHGLVTDSVIVTVTAGAPVQLVVDPLSAAITADQTLPFTGEVQDAKGNAVPTETITFSTTNGSVIGGPTYIPWTTGTQTIMVTWGLQSKVITVLVSSGPAVRLVIADGVVMDAGDIHQYFLLEVQDVKGNVLPHDQAGNLTWQAQGGMINSTGAYAARQIGNWTVRLLSDNGATGTGTVQVTFGRLADIEITASALNVTADEFVTLTLEAVDIHGNRQPLTVPLGNWTTVTNGTLLVKQAGVYTWTPWATGDHLFVVEHAGSTDSVGLRVFHGAASVLTLSGGDIEVTADEVVELTTIAQDVRGNTWFVNTSVAFLSGAADSSWLHRDSVDESLWVFEPNLVGTWSMRATLPVNGSADLTTTTTFTVVHGAVARIELAQVPGQFNTLSADASHDLAPIVQDADGNDISPTLLTWTLDGIVNTTALALTNWVWEATSERQHWINASDGILRAFASINVTVGRPVLLIVQADASDLVAGQSTNVTLTGVDADGNPEAVGGPHVTWATPSGVVKADLQNFGRFRYTASAAGSHTIAFAYEGTNGTWLINVRPGNLDRFELNLSHSLAEQQEIVTVVVGAFDAYDNVIDVPQFLVVQCGCVDGGLGKRKAGTDDTWTMYVIMTGVHQVKVQWSDVTATEELEVTATVAGTLEVGGPLYYVAGGLGLLILLAIIILLALLALRGGGGDDEDDFEEEPMSDRTQRDHGNMHDASNKAVADQALAALDAPGGGGSVARGPAPDAGPGQPSAEEIARAVDFVQRTGVMQAVSGTIQGQSGWYVDVEGTLGQWQVDAGGGWNRIG